MDLTDLVRGELPKLARLTLGALIVIDVHARDVVQRLVDENIGAITEFEWVSIEFLLWFVAALPSIESARHEQI
jgi:NADH/NAD ratio-sensing transcriptional regulator Rex